MGLKDDQVQMERADSSHTREEHAEHISLVVLPQHDTNATGNKNKSSKKRIRKSQTVSADENLPPLLIFKRVRLMNRMVGNHI